MGKKPIVSLTYENDRISIKNSLSYIKCVTSLLCGLWADLWPFLWVVLSEQTVSYRNNRYFFPYKPFYFECNATMPMLIFPTWATCVVTPSKQNVSTLFVYCCLLVSFISVHGVSSRYNST